MGQGMNGVLGVHQSEPGGEMCREYRDRAEDKKETGQQDRMEYQDKTLWKEEAEERNWAQRKREIRIAFTLREIQNQIKQVIHKSAPRFEKAPKSQLQGGILGYLYHHRDGPVYQKDLEKEFRISRATATNTLQVMERDGLIVRRALDRDARLKRIQMTEEAFQNHRQIEAHMEMMDRCMLEGMTGAEAAELYRLLGILQGNLERLAKEYGGHTEEGGINTCGPAEMPCKGQECRKDDR